MQSGHDLTEILFQHLPVGTQEAIPAATSRDSRKPQNTSLTQDTYSPSQNFNPGPLKYKAEVLQFIHTSTGNDHVINSEMKNLITQLT